MSFLFVLRTRKNIDKKLNERSEYRQETERKHLGEN